MNNHNKKFTGKTILYFTLSQLALMMCHMAVSITDLWVAGKIDTSVQASIGVVGQISALMVLIMSIASGGAMASISQSLGAKRPKRARKYSNLVIALVFLVGSATSITFLLLLPLFKAIFVTSPELEQPFTVFAYAYICYLPFYYTSIAINTVFRAYTYMMMPFITTLIIATVNVFGDLAFGLGYFGFPDYGYHGIALSTFAGGLVGATFNVIMILRKKIIKNLLPPPIRWVKAALPYMLKVSIPSTVGQLAFTISGMAILAMLSRLPNLQTESLAGFVIGMRVESFVLFPLGALGITLSMVSGHLAGRGQYDELYRLGKKVAIIIASFSVITGGLLFTFRNEVIGLFTTDSVTLGYASFFIMIACIVLPLRSYASVTVGIFSGIGATILSSRVAVISAVFIQLPLAYILAYVFKLYMYGIYIAMISSSLFAGIVLIIEYRRKKWMTYGMYHKNK